MGTKFRSRLGAMLRRVGLVAAFLFLAFHVALGGLSLGPLLENREDIRETRERVESLRAERGRLLRRISMLSPDRLDPDFLDERARAVLGWAHPSEVVFLLESGSR